MSNPWSLIEAHGVTNHVKNKQTKNQLGTKADKRTWQGNNFSQKTSHVMFQNYKSLPLKAAGKCQKTETHSGGTQV